MHFFTEKDLADAMAVMLDGIAIGDKVVMGTMNGIKRRARARAIVSFGQQLAPAPPDHSITTMDNFFRRLFGRSISKNTLHRHFATPGRKADNRVDLVDWEAWEAEHGDRLRAEAGQLMADLEVEWREFTRAAGFETGKVRREAKREQRGDAA